jgi:hypothetical protein
VVPSGEWSPHTEFLFSWTEPSGWGEGAVGAGYLSAITDDPVYVVSESDIYSSKRYVGAEWEWSGEAYFHVRARNSYLNLGPQATYKVMPNITPGVPLSPMYAESPQSSGVVGTTRPELWWANAADADPYDVLTYHVQASPSGSWDVLAAEASGIPQSTNSSMSSWKVDDNLSVGGWQWRVRSYDGKQWGEWSGAQFFSIAAVTADLGGSVPLSTPSTSRVPGSMFVAGRAPVDGRVDVPAVSGIGGGLTVVAAEPLAAELEVKQGKNLPGRAAVILPDASGMGASANVEFCGELGSSVEIPSKSSLFGGLSVDDSQQRLLASAVVSSPSWSWMAASVAVAGVMRGRVAVSAEGLSPLGGSLNSSIPASGDFPGRLDVPPYRGLGASTLVPSRQPLPGSVSPVEDAPGAVPVSGSVPSGEWQTSYSVEFSWDEPDDEFYPVAGYYVSWDMDAGAMVDSGGEKLSSRAISFSADGAGKYFFHIRAFNTIGNLGPETVYPVWCNMPPGAVSYPMRVDGHISPDSQRGSTPTFSWGAAVDDDQLDVVSYDLQVSREGSFPDGCLSFQGVASNPVGGVASYSLPGSGRLDGVGLWRWRVRAQDGREAGPWSQTASFFSVATDEDIPASVKLPLKDKAGFYGSVDVVGHGDPGGSVFVWSSSSGAVFGRVVPASPSDSGLDAMVRSLPGGEMRASAMVNGVSSSPMVARFGIPSSGSSPLDASIRLAIPLDAWMGGSTRPCPGMDAPFLGFVHPMALGAGGLPSLASVYTPEHFGFIDEFGRPAAASVSVSVQGYLPFAARADVEGDVPFGMVVSANVEEGVWQSEFGLEFSWTEASTIFNPVDGYYVSFDGASGTQPSDSFTKMAGREASFEAERSGEWWFHLAAKAGVNWSAPVHFLARCNNVPSMPYTPMMVDGADSLGARPTVSRDSSPVFSWGQSMDADGDAVTYTVQISSRPDFDPSNGEIVSMSGIKDFRYTVPPGTLSSGKRFWRVKASDGNQDSPWSPTATVLVNTPPGPPTGLLAF